MVLPGKPLLGGDRLEPGGKKVHYCPWKTEQVPRCWGARYPATTWVPGYLRVHCSEGTLTSARWERGAKSKKDREVTQVPKYPEGHCSANISLTKVEISGNWRERKTYHSCMFKALKGKIYILKS